MADDSNLADLISRAEVQAQRHETLRRVTPRRDSRQMSRMVLIAALLAVTTYACLQLHTALAPPNSEDVARDLQQLIEKSHALIERERQASGVLPGTLPSATLASVVDYEVTGREYRLSANVLGVRVTLDFDGITRTELPD